MLGDAEDAGRDYTDQPLPRAVLLKQRTDNIEGHDMAACKNAKGNIVMQYKASSELSVHLVPYRSATFNFYVTKPEK